MTLDIRKARPEDCSFIAKVMLMAEGTGNELTSYEKMFNLSADELQPILTKLLNNESKGHSLCYESYFVATINGERVASLCAYVEGLHGLSNQMTMGVLMTGFSREEIQKAFKFLAEHKEIQIPKEPGILHMDTGATMPGFTGQGIYSKILKYSEELHVELGYERCHLQVWKKNKRALGLYLAKGYKQIGERISATDPENGKVLLEKVL